MSEPSAMRAFFHPDYVFDGSNYSTFMSAFVRNAYAHQCLACVQGPRPSTPGAQQERWDEANRQIQPMLLAGIKPSILATLPDTIDAHSVLLCLGRKHATQSADKKALLFQQLLTL